MAFRIKKNESASAGIRRLAERLVDDAVEMIETKDDDPAETIHEVRKQLKKFRAVLRLVRDEAGEEVFRRDNVDARDLGRKLSPVRDASVRVSALDHLREDLDDDSPAEVITPIRRRLVSRQRRALSTIRRRSVLPSIAGSLAKLRRRVRAWPLEKEGFQCIEPGLRRVYRQAKRAEAEAYSARTDVAFHEWRKRAKDLRYHVDLLEPVWPEVMKNVEKTLHRLTDCLGDDHDLSDLRRVMTSSPTLTRGVKGVKRVIDRIDRRRSELQVDARPIGARIFSEKPREFSQRVGAYWDAWRS